MPYSELTDTELLQLIPAGDEQAMTEIYTRYWRKLFSLAYYHLQCQQDAEDVVQSVLTSLWVRKEELSINNLENYLASAVKYSIYQVILKREKKDRAFATLKLSSSELPQIDTSFLKQMILHEVNKLPQRCRIIFMYSREYGFSNREIADMMNITQKAVEKQITKALHHLRTQMKHFFFFF
jgi:RNA polymerase sigma-70 factor (ECF subfamily)